MTKKEELLDFINSVDTKKFDGIAVKYQFSNGARVVDTYELTAVGKANLIETVETGMGEDLKFKLGDEFEVVGYYECKFNW